MLSERFAANRQVLDRLEGYLSCGRFPHAVLFTGEPGAGKTALAKLAACGLVCKSDPADRPCGVCPGCRKAEAGVHPDIMIFGEGQRFSSLKKEEIERLRNLLYLEPNEADRKVFILDNAGELTAQAANSLLKALEEPPENTVLILTARNRSDLLPTVLSRVVEFSLVPPQADQAAPYIMSLSGAGEQAARDAAQKFGGNIGRAAAFLSETAAREQAEKIGQILEAQQKPGCYALTVALCAWQSLERKEILSLLGLLHERYGRAAAAGAGGDPPEAIGLRTVAKSCESIRKAMDYLAANAPAATVLVWLAAELKV